MHSSSATSRHICLIILLAMRKDSAAEKISPECDLFAPGSQSKKNVTHASSFFCRFGPGRPGKSPALANSSSAARCTQVAASASPTLQNLVQV